MEAQIERLCHIIERWWIWDRTPASSCQGKCATAPSLPLTSTTWSPVQVSWVTCADSEYEGGAGKKGWAGLDLGQLCLVSWESIICKQGWLDSQGTVPEQNDHSDGWHANENLAS